MAGYGPVVVTALSGVFSGRLYPGVPPDNPGRTAMGIFQRVGGVPIYFTEGRLPDEENARVQVTIWAESAAQADQMARQCREIAAEHPDMLPLDVPVGDYNEVLKLHGARFDLAVWYTA